MGWTSTLSPVNGSNTSALPLGVDQIYAIEGDNSLIVFSTVDGFNLVKEIAKNLDLPSRTVSVRMISIKVELVFAHAADVTASPVNFSLLATSPPVSVVSGSDAVRFYSLTKKMQNRLIMPTTMSTTNDCPVCFPMTQRIPFSTVNTIIMPNGESTTPQQNYQVLEKLVDGLATHQPRWYRDGRCGTAVARQPFVQKRLTLHRRAACPPSDERRHVCDWVGTDRR